MPTDASYLRTEPAGCDCHDTGYILGDTMMAVCAGDDGLTVWTLAGSRLQDDPAFLYTTTAPGVSVGHSAIFTWDSDPPPIPPVGGPF